MAGASPTLAREASGRGWWAQYEDLDLDPYIRLEHDASSITAYSALYLHGLVQTEDYARAVIRAIAPQMRPAVLEHRVEARLRRQQLLDRASSPSYSLLLDEAALHRPVGGREVMTAQIGKLRELSAAGRVRIQLIPFAAGAYSAADLWFTLLDFGEPVSSVVYVEGLVGNQYHDRPEDVARYRESLEMIRDSALSPAESGHRLLELQKAYADGQPSPL
jgi:hypothetical protein